ncbi:hypothetical protein JWH04_10295 [Xanthomonas melonis]|nr:hypothetical protein [Xanthomonas melonis]MCD0279325.1 hypothetical protein [Xanthomonas melonis]
MSIHFTQPGMDAPGALRVPRPAQPFIAGCWRGGRRAGTAQRVADAGRRP